MEIPGQTSDLSELSGTIHSERVVFGSSDATLLAVAVWGGGWTEYDLGQW